MKKIFTFLILVSLSIFVFSLGGCDNLFVDSTAVHNGLVNRMDALIVAEEAFYDQYYAIEEGDDIDELVSYYENFVFVASELDNYFESAKFTEDQNVFIIGYNDFYKAEVDAYLAYAGEFVDMLKLNGFVLAEAEPYFEKIDSYGENLVLVHNRLIDVVNLQIED